MCELKKYHRTSNTQIDKCMIGLIKWLKSKHITVGSCCGHNRYPMTIIVKEGINMPVGQENKIVYREIISQKIIPRTRRFYKKDKDGYYFIPEVSDEVTIKT